MGYSEDPRDALVLREDYKGHTLATLPQGSIIGKPHIHIHFGHQLFKNWILLN